MKSDYCTRKEARIDRLYARAEKKENQSNQACNAALGIISMIPPGQPILIGHHSERRHRADLARSDNHMRKSVQLQKEADRIHAQAVAAEYNTAISSDNPEALELLKEKLIALEALQERMKATNKAFKKGPEALQAMGYSEKEITLLAEIVEKAYSWDKKPYAGYLLTNNNQTIKLTKQRIAALEKAASEETQTIPFEGGKIVDNVEENRVQIFFEEIPSKEIRDRLKRNGFKWARSQGAWQRFRSNGTGLYSARYALKI